MSIVYVEIKHINYRYLYRLCTVYNANMYPCTVYL